MRATFEEACKLSWGIITAEKLNLLGVEACCAERRELLAKLGWTSEEMVQEAGRRMHLRIEELKAKES